MQLKSKVGFSVLTKWMVSMFGLLLVATNLFGATAALMTSPTPGTTLQGTSVTFSWSAGTGATGYKLAVGTAKGNWNYYNLRVAGTSATVSNLPVDGRNVYVKLTTFYSSGSSVKQYTYIAYKQGTSSTGTAAQMSSPVSGTTLASSSVTFTWTAGTNVSQYRLNVGSSAGASDLFTTTLASTSATVSNLPQDARTLYVTLGSLINGAWSNKSYTYTAASTTVAPPTVPANVTAQAVSQGQVNVAWSASTSSVGVAGYRIYRNGTQLGSVSSTTFSDTSVSASTSYSYKVAAYDASGRVSAQSAAATVTTPAPPTSGGVYPATLPCVAGTGRDYEVGPGLTYTTLASVPWKSLGPGDTVRIHWRSTPYKEKITLMQSGTASAYIKVCGIPDAATGALPIIDGDGATSPSSMAYPTYMDYQTYGVVVLANNYGIQNQYIAIENLQIQGGRKDKYFTNSAGTRLLYAEDATCFAGYRTAHVILRGNIFTNCEGGIFYKSSTNDNDISYDYLVEGNYFFGNGTVNNYLTHNSYTEGVGVVYQYNYFKSLIPGALGGCLKDRSAGAVIRYNWIQGCQRSIDLVETQDGWGMIDKVPSYQYAYIYGNVLVYNNADEGNTFIHYGGDQGNYTSGSYRTGTLYIYNNTVVSLINGYNTWGGGNVELVRADSHTPQSTVEVWNNVLYAGTTDGSAAPIFYILGIDNVGGGVWSNLHLGPNVISGSWGAANTGEPLRGTVSGQSNMVTFINNDPGFVNTSGYDFHLKSTSAAIGLNAAPPSGWNSLYSVDKEYSPQLHWKDRFDAMDAGAFHK